MHSAFITALGLVFENNLYHVFSEVPSVLWLSVYILLPDTQIVPVAGALSLAG